jgi:hypothetical protein
VGRYEAVATETGRTNVFETRQSGLRGQLKACAIAGFLYAVSGSLSPGVAQTVRGRVLDASTRGPVALAYVGLMAGEGQMVVAALAGSSGVFEVEAPSGGEYLLYVARAGYRTVVDGVFELEDGGVVEVQIGLTPEPIELEPVEVSTVAERTQLEVEGFYERAVTGVGTFLIREQIERTAVDRITDAFRHIPNIFIDVARPLVGSAAVMQYPALWVNRAGRRCAPTFYVDRHVVARGGLQPVRPDDFVTPPEIEAIEVYTRTAEIPVGFDDLSDCGVILIWTRRR